MLRSWNENCRPIRKEVLQEYTGMKYTRVLGDRSPSECVWAHKGTCVHIDRRFTKAKRKLMDLDVYEASAHLCLIASLQQYLLVNSLNYLELYH